MKRRAFPPCWAMILALLVTLPVLAQGQTPTSPRRPGSGLIGFNEPLRNSEPTADSNTAEKSGLGDRKSSLSERRDSKKSDAADTKKSEADSTANTGAADGKADDLTPPRGRTVDERSSSGGGGGGGAITGGGGGTGRSGGSGGGGTGISKGESAGISVTGEGNFEPVLQRKLKWNDVPEEGEPLTIEGPMPLTEFLASINIATNWNIVTSENAKEVELPYFNIVEQSPKRAMEILQFLDIYYNFKDMEDSKFLYVMTKEEYNVKSFGDAMPEEFKVAHADVGYIESAFKPLLSKTGRMLADARSGIIYVWDTTDNLELVKKTFKDLDTPLQKREFSIQYADVADVETVLTELTTENGSLLTDARTGTIIVWDMPQVLSQVAEAVERLDVPLQSQTFEIANANAEDLTDSLEVMLTERGIIQVDPRTNALVITDIPARVEKMAEFIKQIDKDLETRTWVIKYGDIDFIADQLETYIPSDMGDIIVNEAVHQITVTGLPARLDKIDELITTWDIKRRQVLIEAFIVEVNNDVEREFNVNWSYFGSNGNAPIFYNGGAGFQADSDANLTVGQLPYSVPLYGGLQLDENGEITRPLLKNIDGKNVVDYIAGNKIAATLDYLDRNDKATILSSPRVVVQDGEEATFENATKVPFVSASTIYGGFGGGLNPNNPNNPDNNFNNFSPNNTNRIEFIDVGTILSVLPYISEENNVLLDIEAEDSTFILRTILSNGSPSTVPEKTVRRAATQLRVASGETVVLGGLRKDRAEKNVSKTPFLGDIPVIGRLFRYPNNKSTNNSLLLFLTTTIVDEYTHPETKELATAEESIAKVGRHNMKNFWGRLKDDIARGKAEISITIGQTGKILSEGEVVTLEDLRQNLFDIAEDAKVLIVLRSHPRAPEDVITAVTEAAMEADLKIEFSDAGVPLVPNLRDEVAVAQPTPEEKK